MTTLLPKFKDVLRLTGSNAQDHRLLLESDGELEIYYSPFDYVNEDARLVIVGITPGLHQAQVANETAARSLASGQPLDQVAKVAKNTASFSGPMRSNLVRLLDYFRINEWLGIETCAHVFTSRDDLVHFTSALRYPVFKGGKNYSGNPGILKTPFLKRYMETYLREETELLQDAIFVPLGKPAVQSLSHLCSVGALEKTRVLDSLPNPSGANAERISYMLGHKSADDLSKKTRADRLDAARNNIRQQMTDLIGSP